MEVCAQRGFADCAVLVVGIIEQIAGAVGELAVAWAALRSRKWNLTGSSMR